MNEQVQAILFARKSKIYFQVDPNRKESDVAPAGYIGAMIANIGEMGFTYSPKFIEEMKKASKDELVNLYNRTVSLVRNKLVYVYHKPMYPNFPKQVAEAAYEELWINAVLHYFGDVIGERIMPEYKKEARFPFYDVTKVKVIDIADEDTVKNMWVEIFESKASPSVQDKEDILTFFDTKSVIAKIPAFDNKERMAFTLAQFLKRKNDLGFKGWAVTNLKTATDVLRVVVAYFDGDVSLSANPKFGKMPRILRRGILNVLELLDQNSVQEDMMRHAGKWIRLGEKLHPGEFKHKFPNVAVSFAKLRNGQIKTFNAKVEASLQFGTYKETINLLKKRPGDFARRLNNLLSKAPDKQMVVNAFGEVANKISTPVLWQLYGYFKNRDALVNYPNRLFIPKGKTSYALKSENNLVFIEEKYCSELRSKILDGLFDAYKTKESMEGQLVYIDPICETLLMPTGNRTASKSMKQVARGSRFPVDEDKSTVRMFVYWKDQGNQRVDLDLSAVTYDENWKYLGHCSWTYLRSGSGQNVEMVHSGDITSAPRGASEFLDVNLKKLNPKVAYVGINVFSFTGQSFNYLDVAFGGWMGRSCPDSGEIYEPKSVENSFSLTAEATSVCPMILDVKNREVIWTDMALNKNSGAYRWGGCVENTVEIGTATSDLISRKSKSTPTLSQIFLANIFARGGDITLDRENATYVIAEDGDLSPYDLAKVTAEWL